MKTSGFTFLNLLIASMCLGAPSLRAEDGLSFFPNNMAATVFDGNVKMLVPKMKQDVKAGDDIKPSNAEQRPETNPETIDPKEEDSKEAAIVPAADSSSLRDKLIKKYGDPKADPSIRVQDNAPPAFKGMLEALDGGDDETAMEFAQQYVKSLQKYQKLYRHVVSLTGEVMKSQNQAEGTAWENVPTMYEDQQLVAKMQDKRVQDLLARAEQMNTDEKIKQASINNMLSISRDRTKIRAFLASRTDIASGDSSTIDLIAFFNPAQINKCATFPEMMQLMKIRGGDSKVTIIGASITASPAQTLDAMKKGFRIPFPLRDGSVLASKLGIKQTCTLAVMSAAQKSAVLLTKPVTTEFMDELITKLEGSPKV